MRKASTAHPTSAARSPTPADAHAPVEPPTPRLSKASTVTPAATSRSRSASKYPPLLRSAGPDPPTNTTPGVGTCRSGTHIVPLRRTSSTPNCTSRAFIRASLPTRTAAEERNIQFIPPIRNERVSESNAERPFTAPGEGRSVLTPRCPSQSLSRGRVRCDHRPTSREPVRLEAPSSVARRSAGPSAPGAADIPRAMGATFHR